MKCEYCASDLSIEYEKCPYCNAPNPFYEAHRKDMKAYAQKYEATRRQVEEKTNRFAQKTVMITVICILLVLDFAAVILCTNIWEINYERYNRSNIKHASKYMAIAQELEDQGDYMGLYALLDSRYSYSSNNPMNEYSQVSFAVNAYVSIVNQFGYAIDGSFYGNEKEFAKKINDDLDKLYENIKQFDNNNFNSEKYSLKHKQTVEGMLDECYVLFEAYLGLDKDTLDSLRELSYSNRQLILEEAAKEVFFNEQ